MCPHLFREFRISYRGWSGLCVSLCEVPEVKNPRIVEQQVQTYTCGFSLQFHLDSQDTGSSADFNQSEIVNEDFSDAPVKGQKPLGGFKGRDTCSIPCDVTVKLLRDEKQSVCGNTSPSFLV